MLLDSLQKISTNCNEPQHQAGQRSDGGARAPRAAAEQPAAAAAAAQDTSRVTDHRWTDAVHAWTDLVQARAKLGPSSVQTRCALMSTPPPGLHGGPHPCCLPARGLCPLETTQTVPISQVRVGGHAVRRSREMCMRDAISQVRVGGHAVRRSREMRMREMCISQPPDHRPVVRAEPPCDH